MDSQGIESSLGQEWFSFVEETDCSLALENDLDSGLFLPDNSDFVESGMDVVDQQVLESLILSDVPASNDPMQTSQTLSPIPQVPPAKNFQVGDTRVRKWEDLQWNMPLASPELSPGSCLPTSQAPPSAPGTTTPPRTPSPALPVGTSEAPEEWARQAGVPSTTCSPASSSQTCSSTQAHSVPSSDPSHPLSDTTTSARPDEEEAKRRALKLERNRTCAQVSRQRKKALVEDMQARCQALESQNLELTGLVSRLTQENSTLRAQLALSQPHYALQAPRGVYVNGVIPAGGMPPGPAPKLALPPRAVTACLPPAHVTNAGHVSYKLGVTPEDVKDVRPRKKVRRGGGGGAAAGKAAGTVALLSVCTFVCLLLPPFMGPPVSSSVQPALPDAHPRAGGRILTSLSETNYTSSAGATEEEFALTPIPLPPSPTTWLDSFSNLTQHSMHSLAGLANGTYLERTSAFNSSPPSKSGQKASRHLIGFGNNNTRLGSVPSSKFEGVDRLPNDASALSTLHDPGPAVDVQNLQEWVAAGGISGVPSLSNPLHSWEDQIGTTGGGSRHNFPWSEGWSPLVMCTEVVAFASEHPESGPSSSTPPSGSDSSVSSPRSKNSYAIPLTDGATPIPQEQDTSKRLPRYSPSGDPIDTASEAHQQKQRGPLPQNGMAVLMTVPALESSKNTKSTSSAENQTTNAPGFTQAFVMVFVAQTAQYVTYACSVPIASMR